MKKYFKLTSNEAIHYLRYHDGTMALDIPEGVRKNLKDLNKLKSTVTVSITMPTHRIFPDNEIDSILLKNLIAEAEQKLLVIMHKTEVAEIMQNIKEAQKSIDYRRSLDGLALYANRNFSSVVKVPVDLKPEVLIDTNFDVKPIYKAIQQSRNFYILAVSRQKIRLMEVLNDKLLEEVDNSDFPFENTSYYTTDPTKLMQDTFMENLTKEYFNVADKRLQKYLLENPLPVILAGDVKTLSYFREMMDDERLVIAQVNGNYDNAPSHEIVKTAAISVELYRRQKNEEYVAEIKKAQSQNLLATDLNDIYSAILLGNVITLYIGNNYSMRGKVEEDRLVISNSTSEEEVSQDIPLVLINKIQNKDTRVIFLDDELLEDYNGIVLVKRF